MPVSALDELTSRVVGQPSVRAAAGIDISLGKIARHMDRQARDEELLRQIVPILLTAPQILLAGGAGTLVQPDLLGPHDGYAWDVRRLVAAGFSAGTVTAYLNFQADENLLYTWAAAGPAFFSTSIILGDSDALIFTATGITGTVTISGQAIQVPTLILPKYLI